MPLLTPPIVFSLCQKCYVWHLQFLQSYLSNFFNCNEDRKMHKWPCNPIPHCVLSAKHCHRQQSQTPAGTELNSCLVCLVLFIAGWPRKLKGCLGEGECAVLNTMHPTALDYTVLYCPMEPHQHKRGWRLSKKDTALCCNCTVLCCCIVSYLRGSSSSSLKLGLGPSPAMVRTMLRWNITSTYGWTRVCTDKKIKRIKEAFCFITWLTPETKMWIKLQPYQYLVKMLRWNITSMYGWTRVCKDLLLF